MSVSAWLLILFALGFLMTALTAAAAGPILLLLFGLSLMMPAPTLAAIAAIERTNHS